MPRFRLALTPAGAAFFVFTVVILIRSLAARNSYEILLSCTALLFLFVLGVIGAWKSQKLKTLEPGWKPPYPMTANSCEDTLITGLEERIPLFFRMHFIVRGRFLPAGYAAGVPAQKGFARKGCPVLVETSAARGEATAPLCLDFPMSGVFNGEGFCRLRDIFGFFSFSCGIPQQKTVKVRSAPCFGKNYSIKAQSGAEDRRNKHSTDEERYYMREYAPGDRFRDINWKSSEKIDTLITRISPDNQEKISRIEVYFRNYGPAKPSLEALWLLDRTKARLSHFLRSLKEQQSTFIFDVRAARGRWEIDDEESLDAFLEDLAGLSFSGPQNEGIVPAGEGELYVFSTACDIGLPSFLVVCHPRPVSLYLMQKAMPHEHETEMGFSPKNTAVNKESSLPISEILHKMDFPIKGCIPQPLWFLDGKIKQLNASAARVENIYAEIKL